MTADEIRAKFIEFFKKHEHTHVKSASLIPKDDPTLLFNNAGMVQFKRVFLEEEKREYVRAVTSQKCVRAGGKHNDLENVGYTSRHHTFFEMLGNFSFGDYFKPLAIELGWDLLVNGYGLNPDVLNVTIYKDDDEAAHLWQDIIGLPEEKIIRLGEKDNFWSMGETGPCGPCTEIHIDQGEAVGCGDPSCAPGCDCDRHLELWNLVFMQYNRDAEGNLNPLPKPSIDTGMGLERISAVVQGYHSNYESDLFRPLLDYVQELSGIKYLYQSEKETAGNASQGQLKTNVSARVIADHARSLSFLIGDGVLPENVGRGYVLRRILRRGVRHGRNLGLTKPFLHEVAGKVIEQMSEVYPELKSGESYIRKVILNEEERFSETLDNGLKLLTEETEKISGSASKVLDGKVAFQLYDTFGFPLDLTQDVLREEGLTVDVKGFESAMAGQREKSRASWKGSGEQKTPEPLTELTSSGFIVKSIAHESFSVESELKLIMIDGREASKAGTGDEVELVFSETPFYGMAGGQAGDKGLILGDGVKVIVEETVRYPGEMVVHKGKVESGNLLPGQALSLLVDEEQRRDTTRNHTATHLLHTVLREELGDHVKQAGSMVSSDRLRFDFSHFDNIDTQTLLHIEERINKKIRENLPVSTEIMSMDEAMKTGAVALFEERYGDTVRVVSVADFSSELCGGTHAGMTGEIGVFVIQSEASVAAGVRRIEALTGRAGLEFLMNQRQGLRKIATALKGNPDNALMRVEKLQARIKELETELKKAKQTTGKNSVSDYLNKAEDISGVKLLATEVEVENPKDLRDLGDQLKDKLGSGIIVLGAENKGKALLLVLVSSDLMDKYHAGNMIKELVKLVGGGGGGRPDMAQAGGQKPENIHEVIKKAKEIVENS